MVTNGKDATDPTHHLWRLNGPFNLQKWGGPLEIEWTIQSPRVGGGVRTVLEVNYLFHAESAQNYLFKKTPALSPGD